MVRGGEVVLDGDVRSGEEGDLCGPSSDMQPQRKWVLKKPPRERQSRAYVCLGVCRQRRGEGRSL